MTLTIYSYPDNPRVHKSLIAAKYVSVHIDVPPFNFGVDNTTPEFKLKNPLGKVPVLDTPEGSIWESNAIARYVARLNPETGLYGSNNYEAGLIDQWIDFSVSQIELPAAAWLYPIFKIVPNNAQATSSAKAEIRNVLATLDKHLLSRTFLVGERISLADIVVSMSLLQLFTTVLDVGFRKAFSNVVRWFTTLINQPNFKEVLGTVQLATKMAVAPKAEEGAAEAAEKPKQEKKPKEEKPKQEKKAKPKVEEEEADLSDREEDSGEPPKGPNPLDHLPPTPLNLEHWKRLYSNEDTRTVALPWFWETLEKDPEGWSLWRSDYKFNSDLEQLFKTNNLVGGLVQRCDKVRKYGFASILIFGEEQPNFAITGVWLFRGTEIIAEMKDVPDYESYEWTKLNPLSNPDDKKTVEDYFAWTGDFEGRVFKDQGKLMK